MFQSKSISWMLENGNLMIFSHGYQEVCTGCSKNLAGEWWGICSNLAGCHGPVWPVGPCRNGLCSDLLAGQPTPEPASSIEECLAPGAVVLLNNLCQIEIRKFFVILVTIARNSFLSTRTWALWNGVKKRHCETCWLSGWLLVFLSIFLNILWKILGPLVEILGSLVKMFGSRVEIVGHCVYGSKNSCFTFLFKKGPERQKMGAQERARRPTISTRRPTISTRTRKNAQEFFRGSIYQILILLCPQESTRTHKNFFGENFANFLFCWTLPIPQRRSHWLLIIFKPKRSHPSQALLLLAGGGDNSSQCGTSQWGKSNLLEWQGLHRGAPSLQD